MKMIKISLSAQSRTARRKRTAAAATVTDDVDDKRR